eukprot:jgi/Ulvmu1/6348/UM029_0056.1
MGLCRFGKIRQCVTQLQQSSCCSIMLCSSVVVTSHRYTSTAIWCHDKSQKHLQPCGFAVSSLDAHYHGSEYVQFCLKMCLLTLHNLAVTSCPRSAKSSQQTHKMCSYTPQTVRVIFARLQITPHHTEACMPQFYAGQVS